MGAERGGEKLRNRPLQGGSDQGRGAFDARPVALPMVMSEPGSLSFSEAITGPEYHHCPV